MKAIEIDLPVSDDYLPGDTATVTLDGTVIARRIDLLPGVDPHPGHLQGPHLQTPHLSSRAPVGHLQGRHLRDPHLRAQRHHQITTEELYHGLYAITVRVFDEIGNEAAGDPPEVEVFLNTGPTPPADLRFDSQDGGGALTFAFTPSTELQ